MEDCTLCFVRDLFCMIVSCKMGNKLYAGSLIGYGVQGLMILHTVAALSGPTSKTRARFVWRRD
jgi:hypothetical protein